jgi:hypothetical protein
VFNCWHTVVAAIGALWRRDRVLPSLQTAALCVLPPTLSPYVTVLMEIGCSTLIVLGLAALPSLKR